MIWTPLLPKLVLKLSEHHVISSPDSLISLREKIGKVFCIQPHWLINLYHPSTIVHLKDVTYCELVS